MTVRSPVEPEKTPEEGYHLTEDLADRAIDWVKTQKALAPDKPFFMYFAPGATHAPHHVPLEWADKYKGQFADGWDALRESIFERQQKLGVVGADAELTARPDEIPAWAEMDDELKPVLEREMEVYAGFLAHTDFHVGRLLDAVEEIGALENTLVYYIIGDNGASAEGTLNGAFNEMANFNGEAAIETPEFMASVKDKLGTPEAYNHYAVGWAWAMCTPLSVDQAGRVALGRHPERHDRALARRLHEQGRDPDAVQPRDRCRADGPRGGRSARSRRSSTGCSRHRSRAPAWSTASITPTRPSATISSTSRCSETEASTTRAGAPSPATAPRGCRPRSCPRSTTTSGSSTTAPTTGPKPTTSQPRIPSASRRSSVCG